MTGAGNLGLWLWQKTAPLKAYIQPDSVGLQLFGGVMNQQLFSDANRQKDYPLDNLVYDVITVMQNKSQALEAYDRYILDAKGKGNQAAAELFEQMKQSDTDCIIKLKEQLAQLLTKEQSAGA
jgi:hypothetical protein